MGYACESSFRNIAMTVFYPPRPAAAAVAVAPQVPPVLNQFVTRALDKNQAETLFKLLLKYR